jgi:hypothetical protein
MSVYESLLSEAQSLVMVRTPPSDTWESLAKNFPSLRLAENFSSLRLRS